MRLLNLGCGTVFHPAWINVDIASSSPEVQIYDIRRKLPYPDAYFDACYSSHVIEHFKPEEAEKMLAECWRVLKPQSIVRIVVPDLESIVREYLKALEQVESGKKASIPNYDWMMLELYDQTVRSYGGGKMGRYMTNPNIANGEFVRARVGAEIDNYLTNQPLKQSVWQRAKSKSYAQLIQRLRNTLAKLIVSLLAGQQAKTAFEEGIFRHSGEIHQWMYDRFSLRRLLEQSGFVAVRVCRADQSSIPDFGSYHLDVINNKVRKPDSLFVEAIKP